MYAIESLVLIMVFVLASLMPVNALQCWACSSETEGYEKFCGRYLLSDKIPDSIKQTGLVIQNCTAMLKNYPSPKDQDLKPVCRKYTVSADGEKIYRRSCDFIHSKKTKWEDCRGEMHESNTIDCTDCTHDFCNRSIGIVPNTISFVVTITVAKILLY